MKEMEREEGLWPHADAVISGLCGLQDETYARSLLRFFKTEPGSYGYGDCFLGIRVPQLRRHLGFCKNLPEEEIPKLLASDWHEVRMFALLLWVQRYRRGDEARREGIFSAYLAHTERINNWDLVDVSAAAIVGTHLLTRDRGDLYRLAASDLLWDRRIAMVSTLAFIRKGEFEEILHLADLAAGDKEPLMHKAAGWMLREVGKQNPFVLRAFLAPRCRSLPRVLLRYSLEHFPEEERRAYLAGKPSSGGGA